MELFPGNPQPKAFAVEILGDTGMRGAPGRAWWRGAEEVTADEGPSVCQMKFVPNSHLLGSRSYKVCAVQVNYLLHVFKHEISSKRQIFLACVIVQPRKMPAA